MLPTGNYLIYHSGALGDFIATFPALCYFFSQIQHLSRTFLGKQEHGTFGIFLGLFDTSIDIDSSSCALLFSDDHAEVSQLPLLKDITHAILFCDPLSPLIATLRANNIEITYQHSPFPSTRHSVYEYHLGLVTDLPLTACGLSFPLIRISKKPIPFMKDADLLSVQNLVLLHPGSGSLKKNWDLNNFLECCDTFITWGYTVVWIVGPADRHVRLRDVDRVLDSVPLESLCMILTNATLFLGNDSGLAHCAAACGCQTCVLFGPTDPCVWKPWGSWVSVIQAQSGSMDEIHVEQVMAQCRTILSNPAPSDEQPFKSFMRLQRVIRDEPTVS